MADNASITILRNTQANINAEPIKDGNILFTTDQAKNKIYTDVGTRRIQIGGTIDVDTELSTTSTNPVQNKIVTNNINDVRGQICTNLLNPTAPTQTINGITFTNNGDGTYTVNGTASEQVAISPSPRIDITQFQGKRLRIVGCPLGGSFNKYQFNLNFFNSSDTIVGEAPRDFGEGLTFDVPDNAIYCNSVIIIRKGVTANNLLFKPMLTTDLNATYDDFVPYTGDSGRLNEDVAALVDSVRGRVCTNLLNPTAPTQTVNGVTFTNNGDGTYTANGTASTLAVINLNYVNYSTLSVPVGTYKLTGTPSNNGGVRLEVVGQGVYFGTDTGSGRIFTVPQDATSSWVRIFIDGGQTVNNLLFKPMITTDLSATYDDFVPYTGDSGRLNEDVANLFDMFHPIGSLYPTTNASFNPNTANGWHGTWERIKDCVIYAAGDSDTVGQIVGSNTHTLTTAELPSHTHSTPQLTATGGKHRHSRSTGSSSYLYATTPSSGTAEGTAVSGGTGTVNWNSGTYTDYADNLSMTVPASNTGYTGSGTAIDMRPRRLNSVVWRRIA